MLEQQDNTNSDTDSRAATHEEQATLQSFDAFEDIDDILVADVDRCGMPHLSDAESSVSLASKHSTNDAEQSDIEVEPTAVGYMGGETVPADDCRVPRVL